MKIDIDRFAEVMAYMGVSVGKAPTKEQIRVYYDLLGDLPIGAFQFAAKQAVLESQYPTIPPVGVIRKLAVEFSRGGQGMTAGEAYELARQAIKKFGYPRQLAGLASLPEPVAAITKQIGWDVWCNSEDPTPLRARFVEFWTARQAREQRQELLPESMRHTLEHQQARLRNSIAKIGEMPVDVREITANEIFSS